MGRSKAEKAKTHKRIVSIASKRLREEGFAGPGIAELMKETGLTFETAAAPDRRRAVNLTQNARCCPSDAVLYVWVTLARRSERTVAGIAPLAQRNRQETQFRVLSVR